MRKSVKVAELSTVASTFEEIKSRAESRWQQLWKSDNPVVMVGTATCGRAAGALEENNLIPSFADFPRAGYEQKIILKNCGQIDPADIDHYIANGGYEALVKALQMPSTEVIDKVEKSGLM